MSFRFALMAVATVYVFVWSHGNFKYLVMAQGAFILFALISILLRPRLARYSRDGLLGTAMLASVLFGNLLVNAGNYDQFDSGIGFAAAHVVGIVAYAFAAQWAAHTLQPERILSYIAYLLTPLILWIDIIGFNSSGEVRINTAGLHPNWWGETAFAMALGALAVTRPYTRVALLALAALTMYFVQSRGALVATVLAILTYQFLQFRPLSRTVLRRTARVMTALFVGLIALLLSDQGDPLVEFIVQRVLFLDNPYRGLDSGLTGRLEGWLMAIQVFIYNPVFGQGIDTLTEVHNGFLRWAGEGGITLLGLMLLLITTALIRAWRSHNHLLFAALTGIIAYLMTYPRALNLNLVGLVFLLSLFPWRSAANPRITRYPSN